MNDNGKFLLGLVAGLGIGAAIGILIAPEEGSKTLKKLEGAIKDATNDLTSYTDKKVKEVKKKSTK